ncbi:arsinothricin resistance N-acetyltransferase ArsN1 family B [Spartinivicinus ruber]|uniref:arsinothricin resistance N-acetyltransferase ArsN1 family B n=1 Tax=Spartinivicinus ruber TaxID=2683272 RepID=UPI0013D0DC5C|nr:arsinothricin resistance N-acetyltransferase ArsN1 family B [Spartinivicinus ruber]
MIRQAKPCDAENIANIYNHYISNTVITFEEESISADEMNNRIQEIMSMGLPWLIAEKNGEIVGYAYASKWNGRCAYRFSVEATVYLSPSAKSEGWGTKLYEELFSMLRESSIHVVIGGIALPNPASIALHEKFGMEKVAHFKEVGFKFGQWVDVGYWQVELSA